MIEKNENTYKMIKNLTVFNRNFIFDNEQYEIQIHGFLNKILWNFDQIFFLIIMFTIPLIVKGNHDVISFLLYCGIYIIILLISNTIQTNFTRKKLFYSNDVVIVKK